jgi:PAS domain S-box-containing protein
MQGESGHFRIANALPGDYEEKCRILRAAEAPGADHPGARRLALTKTESKRRSDSAVLNAEVMNRIPVGLIVLQLSDFHNLESARILEINPAATSFMRAPGPGLRGKTLAEVGKFAKPEILELCREALRTDTSVELGEFLWPSEGTGPLVYSLRAFPLSGNCVLVTLEDITARKSVERELHEGEERFRLLVRGVRDYGILMLDRNGYILSWNEGAERLKGYREAEIVGKHFSVFYLPEDVHDGKPEANLKAAVANGNCEDEGWRVRKDGSRFWANVVITALRDGRGELCGFAKVTRDVAERRKREEALWEANEKLELRLKQRAAELLRVNGKLRAEVKERERAQEKYRALAMRQEQVREDERTHVAREMHDELGQICTALKMDLAWIAQRLPEEQGRLRERTESALTLVTHLIQSVRRISAELRPSTLDSLGLVSAMEWQAQEFQLRTGIPCRIVLPEQEVALDPERATAIFRIFQETLTNIARHAKATSVQATVVLSQENVLLVVHDNGKGFDASSALSRGSPGLLGMQERAYLIGGQFKISSAPESGTTVSVQIPFRLLGKEQGR